MEVRTCGATGRSHLADDLPGCDQVSIFDQDLRQVKVHRVEAQAVIDEDSPAGENMIHRNTDDSVIRRCDIGPHRRADILSIVGIARRAVHDPHAAKNAGALAMDRLYEVAVPEFQS